MRMNQRATPAAANASGAPAQYASLRIGDDSVS
jgi:hypothetical protein